MFNVLLILKCIKLLLISGLMVNKLGFLIDLYVKGFMLIGFFLLLIGFKFLILSRFILWRKERFGFVSIKIKILDIFCLNRVLFDFFKTYFLFLRILIRLVLV